MCVCVCVCGMYVYMCVYTHTHSTLLTLGLAVAASIHVPLYVQFSNTYLAAKWVGSFTHLLCTTKKYLYGSNNWTLRFRLVKLRYKDTSQIRGESSLFITYVHDLVYLMFLWVSVRNFLTVLFVLLQMFCNYWKEFDKKYVLFVYRNLRHVRFLRKQIVKNGFSDNVLSEVLYSKGNT
jgi:hypothetical protein